MTEAACQRALGIQEIVRMVCNEADVGWYRPQTTLISLATTSKMFSDPALDVVWHEQRSLIPLVKCMPESLWEERGVRRAGTGPVIHLRRPITSADMPRFLFYSVRVRDLNLRYSFNEGTLHHDFLRALDMCMPAQSFMPKLGHFTWSPKKNEVLSIMRHFFGPQMRQIDLVNLEGTGMLSILPFIKSSCPHLTSFTLRGIAGPLSRRSVSDAVCGWQHLTELSISNLDQAGFMHVAQLAALTSLSLCSQEDTTLHPPDFLSGPTFPALKSLYIRCETPRFCTGIIQVISCRQFESLNVCSMASWTASAWQKLHATLRHCLNHAALSCIGVEEDGNQRPADIAPYILSSEALRPLLTFNNLTSISYQLYPGVDFDDDFLEEMAQAWPRLHILQFDTELLLVSPPQATLKCLIPFARNCPDLEALGVRMNATHVPEFTQVRGDRLSHPLDCMYLGTSRIDAEKEGSIAAFISNLFPELQDMIVFGSETQLLPETLEAHATSWKRVSKLLPIFSSVRTQEEEFWTEEVDDSEESEEER